jgi:hypothetical protein
MAFRCQWEKLGRMVRRSGRLRFDFQLLDRLELVGPDAAGGGVGKAEQGLRYQPRSREATLDFAGGLQPARGTGGKHDEANTAEKRRHGLRDPLSVVMTVLTVTTKFGSVYTATVILDRQPGFNFEPHKNFVQF